MTKLDEQVYDLAVANRILAREDVVDGYGHVSIRHPGRADRFFVSCSRSPELVEVADIVEVDLDCKPIEASDRQMYTELPIHAAIYKLRPDVMAVVHSHAYEVIPYSTSKTKLRPILHSAGVIGHEIPVWDIRDRFGDTDMLVRTMEQGLDLAARLGRNDVVLMRGHGCVVTAESLPLAVRAAVYLKVNAKVQTEAMAFGENRFLSDGEISAIRGKTAPSGIRRLWEYWARRCQLPTKVP
ncbi:MAG TPA: class II aldolase/adducin family protein [Stellaceae bacterium]|nr:class II aldolase/adducin family protein [Stellaceae bacterium]